jgi:3-phosphoshikimate 1-carboxyvinyltransferase
MELTVHTSKNYQILIERGCLDQIGTRAQALFRPGSKVLVIGDTNVLPIYETQVKNSLLDSGFLYSSFKTPAGESFKRLKTIEYIYKILAEKRFTRSDFIIALGGGVTGDMAGFAAATYLRGIDFIQVPTSLLAQIDSSVGGKTGVDLPNGKNLVGAFHQPRLVLIDPDTLSTLPPRYFSDGMGEAIKYGCIKSRELFDLLQQDDVTDKMEDIIYRCVDIKRKLVECDEFDNGKRMLLNFGHTFGHALELLYDFEKLSHGEAIGIGMVMISRCSEAAGITKAGTADEIISALKKFNLPIEDDMLIEKILVATALDKKSSGGNISLVLLNEIGDGFVNKISRRCLSAEKGASIGIVRAPLPMPKEQIPPQPVVETNTDSINEEPQSTIPIIDAAADSIVQTQPFVPKEENPAPPVKETSEDIFNKASQSKLPGIVDVKAVIVKTQPVLTETISAASSKQTSEDSFKKAPRRRFSKIKEAAASLIKKPPPVKNERMLDLPSKNKTPGNSTLHPRSSTTSIVKIQPSVLSGRILVPPSKSAVHRAIICSTLAGNGAAFSSAEQFLSDDLLTTTRAMNAVHAHRGNKMLKIDCGESGSTLRFLIPVVAALGIRTEFTGHGQLPERPIGVYLDCLPEHGISCKTAGGLPLTVSGRLEPGEFVLPGNVSSQFISGLMLALPLLKKDSRIVLSSPLESASYVAMTVEMLSDFGIRIGNLNSGWHIAGNQSYLPRQCRMERDWSQAAFFLAAGALGGTIKLDGLNPTSCQGDRAAEQLFRAFGAKVEWNKSTLCVSPKRLNGLTIDASQIPDLVPILAATAAVCKGRTRIYNAQRLRIKESDRLAAMADGLTRLGGKVQQTDDGLIIDGVHRLHGGEVNGYNDHRIVMAFAIAALKADGCVSITDARSINKSYPTFFTDYNTLGGNANVVDLG